ncbi:MAG: helix-turn-helix domain-containing protein [Dysgonamonadaceae bacterium]|jgi:DNA-binding XRE family transcriptional regulator|nr:helix-turn-helix domain-containing protein [Dysgonamonadaceae bacterium]
MLERIKKIIGEKGLNNSEFALKIDVEKGTITHVLSGRNNPSLTVIQKILTAFPDISPDWLLAGKEPMYRKRDTFIQPPLVHHPPGGLFGGNTDINTGSKPPVSEYPRKKEVEREEKVMQKPKEQEIRMQENTTKKIEKITVFFSDNTFLDLSP